METRYPTLRATTVIPENKTEPARLPPLRHSFTQVSGTSHRVVKIGPDSTSLTRAPVAEGAATRTITRFESHENTETHGFQKRKHSRKPSKYFPCHLLLNSRELPVALCSERAVNHVPQLFDVKCGPHPPNQGSRLGTCTMSLSCPIHGILEFWTNSQILDQIPKSWLDLALGTLEHPNPGFWAGKYARAWQRKRINDLAREPWK